MKLAAALLGLLMVGGQEYKPVITYAYDGCNTTTYVDGVATTSTLAYCSKTPLSDLPSVTAPLETKSNLFVMYGDGGISPLVSCDVVGEWREDSQVASCKMSKDSSLDEVLNVILRAHRQDIKMFEDDRKRTLADIDNVLNLLNGEPSLIPKRKVTTSKCKYRFLGSRTKGCNDICSCQATARPKRKLNTDPAPQQKGKP